MWLPGSGGEAPGGDLHGVRYAVAELAFRDGIMEQIRLRERRFLEHAYLFVLSALEYCQSRLAERRHIAGRELAVACRDLALTRYGVIARLVLEAPNGVDDEFFEIRAELPATEDVLFCGQFAFLAQRDPSST